MYTLPKLTHVEKEHKNISVTNNKIKTVIKFLPPKKSPGSGGFTAGFYQTFSLNYF
jgi:hypothetical protein